MVERELERGVARLDVVVGGVRAAVRLEVELAAVVGQRLLRDAREPVRDRRPRPRRGRDEGQVLVGRAAAAVAVAVDQELVPLARGRYALVVERAVVRRDHRGDQRRAVVAVPAELRVGPAGGLVPLQLGGREVRHAGVRGQGREGRRKAERVGQPGHGRLDAEVVARPADAVRELAQQRLAAGRVRVALHPQRRDARVPAAADPRAHALEQRVVGRLHPGVELRHALREDEALVVLDLAQRGGERAQRLALGLAVRPEPGDVEVRVPDQRDVDRPAARRYPSRTSISRCIVRLLLGAGQHPAPAHAVAGRQARDRQAAPLDLERDLVRAGQRRQVDRGVLAVERAAHDAVDAQQRAGPGRVRQPQRAGGKVAVPTSVTVASSSPRHEANAHQRVAETRSLAVTQLSRAASCLESST